MQIMHEAHRPYNLTSLTDPLTITHFWTLSGHMLDFKLEQLDYLEETTGPTFRLDIDGNLIDVPSAWNLVAVEQESYTIDTIPVSSCAIFGHDIVLFSPIDTKLVTAKARIVDYFEDGVCVHPLVPKGSAVIAPVKQLLWHGQNAHYGIIATPHDLHRYIGGRAVGEILG